MEDAGWTMVRFIGAGEGLFSRKSLLEAFSKTRSFSASDFNTLGRLAGLSVRQPLLFIAG